MNFVVRSGARPSGRVGAFAASAALPGAPVPLDAQPRLDEHDLSDRRRLEAFRLIGFGPPLLDNLPAGWSAGPVRWCSDFHISHRMVETMTAGRVCLGGDTAHIQSPIGARGMNLGIEDAWVFAACAADFLSGQAGRLDDYDRVRRPVDAAVVRRVRALTSAVRDTSGTADLMRRLAIPLLSRLPLVMNRILRVGMGLDHPVRVR